MERQNITYFPQEIDHGQSNGGGDSQDQFHSGQMEFHTSSNPNFHVSSNERSFYSGSGRRTQRPQIVIQQNPITLPQKLFQSASGQQTVHVQLVPPGTPATSQQQHIIISAQPNQSTTPNSDSDNPISAFMEYFVEQQQQPGCSSNMPQYRSPMTDSKFGLKNRVLLDKGAEKQQKDVHKRARQAEAARQRYHRLTAEEKKTLNLKRTLAQKRKKQREKEMAQLESILRASGDIYDDPEVLEQLREKRMRAKWAESARSRYQRMTDEERKNHNLRRRAKQQAVPKSEQDSVKDGSVDEETQRRIKEQNDKKAETARLRYHRMSTEEKKLYNQRRTEAFRRRRMEEEALLAMPIGRINGEALDRAQQIVIRNAKRAEAARLRYQKMTPDQRRAYNQKRYTPKRKRQMMEVILANADGEEGDMHHQTKTEGEEEFDALSSLERDVLRRTQQAQQALLRQRAQQQTQQIVGTTSTGGVVLKSATPTHIIQQQPHSGSPRSHQQQIILQQQPGTSQQAESGIPQQQQVQYISTSSAGGTRIRMSGQQGSQQVTYVTTTPQHQRA